MDANFDLWDDFADLSMIGQNPDLMMYKVRKRESAQVINNRYIIG